MFALESPLFETDAQVVELERRDDFFLRAMCPEDLPQVVALETHSQRDPWAQQSFLSEFDNPRVSQPLVALLKNEVVGYIVPWFITDEVQIANLAVKENYRQQGLGRFMLSQVLHLAQKRQCRSAFLEVRKSNQAARRLYESLGFIVEGLRPHYYGRGQEDAILMKKNLIPENTF